VASASDQVAQLHGTDWIDVRPNILELYTLHVVEKPFVLGPAIFLVWPVNSAYSVQLVETL
jgi:hypothetical protein